MTAITLHLPQGVATITRRSANGILLPVSIDAVPGWRSAAPSEENEADKLLREVVALKYAKKK